LTLDFSTSLTIGFVVDVVVLGVPTAFGVAVVVFEDAGATGDVAVAVVLDDTGAAGDVVVAVVLDDASATGDGVVDVVLDVIGEAAVVFAIAVAVFNGVTDVLDVTVAAAAVVVVVVVGEAVVELVSSFKFSID
jgi:hypothetical protein